VRAVMVVRAKERKREREKEEEGALLKKVDG